MLDAVRREPDSVEAHHALATFYVQQGKLDVAIPHLRRARAIDPADYATGYDLALALLETGKLDEARAQVARMMEAEETAELHNLLGNVEERAGNRIGAAGEYQRAAHMAPTEEHLFDWGNNLVQLRAFGGHRTPSAVREAPRRPRDRALLSRAIRRRRQIFL